MTNALKIQKRFNPMRILHVIDTLNDEDGGPTRSVTCLARAQASMGDGVAILARRSNRCVQNEKFLIHQECSSSQIAALISQTDVVHIHGVWPLFLFKVAQLCHRLKVTYFLSPRGMLQPWSLKQKRIKKLIAWYSYQRRVLEGAACIVVTAEIEENAIRKLLPSALTAIVPNPIENLGLPKEFIDKGYSQALFLSRIHKKKGILDLVQAWLDVKPENWKLVIAGNSDDSTWQSILDTYQNQIWFQKSVVYVGFVDGLDKETLYKESDVLILPTYSENFGLVVAESLSVGTPVVTTTETPWTDLAECGCGKTIIPGYESVKNCLSSFLKNENIKLFEMGVRGVDFIRAKTNPTQIALLMRSVYEESAK